MECRHKHKLYKNTYTRLITTQCHTEVCGIWSCALCSIYTLLLANAFKENTNRTHCDDDPEGNPSPESVGVCVGSRMMLFLSDVEETIEKQLCFYCRWFGYRGSVQKVLFHFRRCRCRRQTWEMEIKSCAAVSFVHMAHMRTQHTVNSYACMRRQHQ